MTVYAGAVAPESVVIVVSRGSSSLDLSTVTSASLSVEMPDQSVVTSC